MYFKIPSVSYLHITYLLAIHSHIYSSKHLNLVIFENNFFVTIASYGICVYYDKNGWLVIFSLD